MGMNGPLSAYIVAGEPSGDRLGGALMQGLATETGIAFHGVGGRDMIAAGLDSLFDMSELSVMGVSEVLPRLPNLLRRIRQTAQDIIARCPDVLITIDSPDFTLRVAPQGPRSLARVEDRSLCCASSVWAWRPARARKMARYVDHVLALLPFEPAYMQAAGMTCDFVGHPVAGRAQPTRSEIAAFRKRHGIADWHTVLLLAPGSRHGEIRRLLPDFCATIMRLRAEQPDLAVVCPVAETVEADVRGALSSLLPPAHLVLPNEGEVEKLRAFAAADLALCASGTVTLELAAAGTPMVAAYKTTWLTAQIVRRVVKISSANLINIVHGQPVVPEFLQERCTVAALTSALRPLLHDGPARTQQSEAFDAVLAALGRDGVPPARRAARSVLAALGRSSSSV